MNRALLFQAMEPNKIPRGGIPDVQSIVPKVGRSMHQQWPTNRNPLLQQLKKPLGPIEPLALWGVNDYNTARGVLPCAYQGVKVGRTPNPTPPNVVNVLGGQSRSQQNAVTNGFRPLNLPLQAPTWSNSGGRAVAWAVKAR